MTRGRAPNLALPLTRSLAQQREYRARRAARLKELEDEIKSLKEQVDVLKRERGGRSGGLVSGGEVSAVPTTHLISTIFTLEHILQSHAVPIPPNLMLIIQRLRQSPSSNDSSKAYSPPIGEMGRLREEECGDPTCIPPGQREGPSGYAVQSSYTMQNKRRRLSSESAATTSAGLNTRPGQIGSTPGADFYGRRESSTGPWTGSRGIEGQHMYRAGSVYNRGGSIDAASVDGHSAAYYGSRSHVASSSHPYNDRPQHRVDRLSFASDQSVSHQPLTPGGIHTRSGNEAGHPQYFSSPVQPIQPQPPMHSTQILHSNSRSATPHPVHVAQSPHEARVYSQPSPVNSAMSRDGSVASIAEERDRRFDGPSYLPVNRHIAQSQPTMTARADGAQPIPPTFQKASFDFDPNCCGGLFSCEDMPMEIRARCDSAVKMAVDPALSGKTVYDAISQSPMFGVDSPGAYAGPAVGAEVKSHVDGCGSASGCGVGMKCNDLPQGSARKAIACQGASQTLSMPSHPSLPHYDGVHPRIANLQPSYAIPTPLSNTDRSQRDWSPSNAGLVTSAVPVMTNTSAAFDDFGEDKGGYGFQPELCCLGLVDCDDAPQTCPIAN